MTKQILNFIFYTLVIISGIICAIVAAYTESCDIASCLILIAIIAIIGGIVGYLIQN